MAGGKRRKALQIVGTLLVLGLIPLFRYWDIPIAAAQVDSAALAYRHAGLPWVARDLDPVPPVSDSENAAAMLHAAIEKIPRSAADVLRKLHSAEPSDVTRAKVELASYDEALFLAHAAAQRPRLDFHRDWAMGPALIFPEPGGMKLLVRALDVRAEIRAKNGDGVAAASDLRDAMKIASLVGTEPYPLSLVCAVQWEESTAGTIERCIELAKGNETQIVLLRGATDSAVVPRLGPALLGQSFDGLTMYRNYKFFGPAIDYSEAVIDVRKNEIVRNGIPAGFTARAYATRHMQGWVEIKQAMDRLGEDPVALSKVQDEISMRYYNHLGSSYRLSAIAFPVFGQLAHKLVDLRARLAAIRRG